MNSTTPKAKKVKQKLIQVQTKVLVVGVLPTSGSIGPVLGPGPCQARPPRHRRERGEHQEIRRLARELRSEAVGRRPAGRRDWPMFSDLARSSPRPRWRPPGAPGARPPFCQIHALQLVLHGRGGGGLLVRR